MARADVDLWFATWRRTGDPGALAKVFDATAPELLLVAGHLTRDAAAAEDLVQTVFLEAIEHGERWDESRPLRPWLVGIAVHHARRARRDARRAVDRDRLPVPTLPEPGDVAAARELTDALAAALRAVPQPYREVLNLRLVHGLAPREIAHALSRPPETVKTQLRRGLEMLRRALPPSLVPAVAMFAVAERGLAAVREVVLSRVASASSAGPAIGGLLLVKKLLVTAALVLGCTAARFLFRDLPQPSSTAATATRVDAHAAGVTAKHASERAEVTSDLSPPEADAAARLVSIRGRCLDAVTREPLPGCTLYLNARYRSDGVEAAFGPMPYERPDPPPRTGADGRFELTAPAAPCLEYTLVLQPRSHLPRLGDIGELAVGRTVDLGDVEHPPGRTVGGTVVDEQGLAVEGARLRVDLPAELVALRPGAGRGGSLASWGDSDASGAFALEGGLLPGPWPLELHSAVEGSRFELIELQVVHVGEHDVTDLLVRVRRLPPLPRITGRVVDERGRGVARTIVTAQGRRGYAGSTRSAADGAFTVFLTGSDAAPDEPVRLRAEGKTHLPVESREEVAWGAGDVVLRTRACPGLALRVLDPKGQPVERYGVYWSSDRGDGLGRFGRHTDGCTELADVPPGNVQLRVIPARRDVPVHEVEAWVPDGGRERLTIRLPAAPPVRVCVLHEDGAPAAGVEVRLLDPGPATGRAGVEELRRRSIWNDARRAFTGNVEAACWRGRHGRELARGHTDDRGRVVLYAEQAAADLWLHLPGPGHVPLVHAPVNVAAEGADVVVRVRRGAEVAGTVTPVGVARLAGASVQLRDAGGTRCHPQSPVPIEADGRFHVADAPAGDWLLYIVAGEWAGEAPVATLRLESGQRARVQLHLPQFDAAALRGSVRLDGAVPQRARLVLVHREREEPSPSGGCRYTHSRWIDVDAHGRFVAEGLVPGQYLAALTIGRDGDDGRYLAGEWFDVAPGSAAERSFAFQSRRCRVRVVDASSGAPRAGVAVELHGEAGLFGFGGRTGADGRAVFDTAPAGRVWLTLDGRGPRGPFAVPPPGDDGAEIVVPLAAEGR